MLLHSDAPHSTNHPSPASFPLLPCLPDMMHGGISEQTSWLQVVVTVRGGKDP